jgi:hypothetical protein
MFSSHVVCHRPAAAVVLPFPNFLSYLVRLFIPDETIWAAGLLLKTGRDIEFDFNLIGDEPKRFMLHAQSAFGDPLLLERGPDADEVSLSEAAGS